MKVKELIEKLQALNPDLEVVTDDPGCGCCGGGYIDVDDPKIETIKDGWDANGKQIEKPAVKL